MYGLKQTSNHLHSGKCRTSADLSYVSVNFTKCKNHGGLEAESSFWRYKDSLNIHDCYDGKIKFVVGRFNLLTGSIQSRESKLDCIEGNNYQYFVWLYWSIVSGNKAIKIGSVPTTQILDIFGRIPYFIVLSSYLKYGFILYLKYYNKHQVYTKVALFLVCSERRVSYTLAHWVEITRKLCLYVTKASLGGWDLLDLYLYCRIQKLGFSLLLTGLYVHGLP